MRLCAVLLFMCVQSTVAAERLAGPVMAQVVSIRDGDTLVVDAAIWPGQTIRVAVRVRGIDTPEMKGKCASERALAIKAKARAAALIGTGPVRLTDIGGGKYYGRILADVSVGFDDLGSILKSEGLARPYGKRRSDWCGLSLAETR